MAITTGAAVEEFGTQTTVITTGSTVNTDSPSLIGDATSFTNTANAVSANFVFTGSFGVAPDVDGTIDLYAQLLDVDGTNDTVIPSASYENIYLGLFPLQSDASGSQTLSLVTGLPNAKSSQEYNFFIINRAGQNLTSGATVKITDTAINSKV